MPTKPSSPKTTGHLLCLKVAHNSLFANSNLGELLLGSILRVTRLYSRSSYKAGLATQESTGPPAFFLNVPSKAATAHTL